MKPNKKDKDQRKVDVNITESRFLQDVEELAESIGYTDVPEDLLKEIATMSREEARFMVDAHLNAMQKRISASNQLSSLKRRGQQEPKVISWFVENAAKQEKLVNTLLRHWAKNQPMARWAMQFKGIGHGIAAALVAYVDPEKSVTAGNIWSIFGFNPNQKWLGAAKAKEWVEAQDGTPLEILGRASQEFNRRYDGMLHYASTDAKGKRTKLTNERVVKTLALRPWNAKLKVVGHYIGESFCKVRRLPGASVYSQLYDERKAYEIARNEAGRYADQALASLRAKPNHKQKAILKKGMLTPLWIHLRVRRYVAKRFLQDFQQELYRQTFGKEPPLPFVFSHLGHAHLQNPLGSTQWPGRSKTKQPAGKPALATAP